MTFLSDLTPKELEAYGFARVRDIAFDAVRELWHRRQAGGMSQQDFAARIGRDPAWVSRSLRGPGNWTLRTIGAFVAGLDGEIEITVNGLEDPIHDRRNTDAYSGYEPLPLDTPWESTRAIPANFSQTASGSGAAASLGSLRFSKAEPNG
jgi:transcriptional regulator with XRE-family HTH domain